MTTSAPQWPGQEDSPMVEALPGEAPGGQALPGEGPALRAVPDGAARRLEPVPAPSAAPDRPQRPRRAPGRRNRLVVVRNLPDRDLWVARRRARANLPPPAAVTRDLALALLEVEAGCRSAAQLERIFSPQLWEALEHRIGRRGGPLPSGRSLISVRCQEDTPGLADTVAVVSLSHVRWCPARVRVLLTAEDARGLLSAPRLSSRRLALGPISKAVDRREAP